MGAEDTLEHIAAKHSRPRPVWVNQTPAPDRCSICTDETWPCSTLTLAFQALDLPVPESQTTGCVYFQEGTGIEMPQTLGEAHRIGGSWVVCGRSAGHEPPHMTHEQMRRAGMPTKD
jgi:hypothetical protein